MTMNKTLWSFPPALNTTFRDTFNAKSHRTDNSIEDHEVYSILLAAVQDLTLRDRVDSGYRDEGWGGENAIVRVGDTVSGTFRGGEMRVYGLNCILCKRGRGLGNIENACSNYTETDNVVPYTKKTGPTSALNLQEFPSLDQYSSIPNETCALCIFTLFNRDDSLASKDYSVPFLVQQQPGAQRKVFNATFPTGVVVPRPSHNPDLYDVPELPPESQKHENSSTNTGLIVGVVVGVLAVASLLMGLAIYLWTRRERRKRTEGSLHSVLTTRLEQPDSRPRSVALQRVQSSVRRPDSHASEVPPPYHEAVHGKETSPRVLYR